MYNARYECPICNAAAYLEETQQLDVRGVRVRLRHVRQQHLLGSVAIDRELLELQADTALQRWMRCSCCAQYVPWHLWPMHCAGVCDRGFVLDRLIGHGHTDKSVRACACVRA